MLSILATLAILISFLPKIIVFYIFRIDVYQFAHTYNWNLLDFWIRELKKTLPFRASRSMQ